MATVYSLICWGGRTGTTVALTIASPCVVTTTVKSRHGLRNGAALVLSTNGTLPPGVTAGTTYYARVVSANKFHLYDTQAHAQDTGSTTGRINTSGSQSGVHTAKSKTMLDLLSMHSGRWGDSGSERCYDGVNAWMSGRSGASNLTEETGEIGEAFTDHVSEVFSASSIPAAKVSLTTILNGARSAGWHGGKGLGSESLTSGYWIQANSGVSGYLVNLSASNASADGFVVVTNTWDIYRAVNLLGVNPKVSNCIIKVLTGRPAVGIFCDASGGVIENNLVTGCDKGIQPYDWRECLIAGNLVTLCINGFYSYTPICYLYNNIAIGNSGSNWPTPGGGLAYMKASTNNAGLSGEAWIVGSGTQITMSTTDFVDYANNDFRPASSTSPQVDSGVEYYGAARYDIEGNERPNYNNGGSEAFDIGCYEYDHGYGPHPATVNCTFSGVKAGSEIRVYLISTGEELAGIESCSADQTLSWQANTNVRIVIISTEYELLDFNYSAGEGNVSIPLTMNDDPWFKDPV